MQHLPPLVGREDTRKLEKKAEKNLAEKTLTSPGAKQQAKPSASVHPWLLSPPIVEARIEKRISREVFLILSANIEIRYT